MGKNIDNKFSREAWNLKHELIVRAIREQNDFDLDEINQRVEEMLKHEQNLKLVKLDTR